MNTSYPTEVVLFDVGGILIRLAGIDAWKELKGEADEAEIWRQWLHCPVVKEYEKGQCSTEDFSRRMVDSHQLPLTPDEFLSAFISWPIGLYEGAREMVADVADHLRVGCFSNTSAVHWELPHMQEVDRMFDVCFLSFEMGKVKPDAEAFHHVVEELACDPGAIFFIDDNVINVDAARSCGIDAHVAKGPEETRSLLMKHGLTA